MVASIDPCGTKTYQILTRFFPGQIVFIQYKVFPVKNMMRIFRIERKKRSCLE